MTHSNDARPKVVIADSVAPDQEVERRILEPLAEVIVVPSGDADALHAELRDADAVLGCYTKFTDDMVRSMTKCRIMARSGIGVDTIPMQIATEKGIIVTNVPDYCIDEVADHAMALMLSLVRRIDGLAQSVRAGTWDYRTVGKVRRLAGLRLGLVGFGNIAQAVARRAHAFKLDLLVHDPYVDRKTLDDWGAQGCELDTLLSQADIVSLHVPLNQKTQHLIADRTLGLMKPDAFLVNTSRGGLVDFAAVRKALERGRLAGAALDVLEQEPPADIKKAAAVPSLLLTPHAAFNSEEATLELREKSATEIARVLRGEKPRYQVNR